MFLIFIHTHQIVYHNIAYVVKSTVIKEFNSFQLFGEATNERVPAKSHLLPHVQEVFKVFLGQGLEKRSDFIFLLNFLSPIQSHGVIQCAENYAITHSILLTILHIVSTTDFK